MVVFLRHAATDYSRVDTGRLNDRSGQRNLSEAGRVQAEELGGAFASLGIEFSRILTSPVYRARDTAEIAFGPGRVEVTTDLVADDYAGGGIPEMIADTDQEATSSSSVIARRWRWSRGKISRILFFLKGPWPFLTRRATAPDFSGPSRPRHSSPQRRRGDEVGRR